MPASLPVQILTDCGLFTLPTDKLRTAWLEILAATVMFPGRTPPWESVIRRRGKPCINWAEMSLQNGTRRCMTLPKSSRRRSSRFLSNSSFPVAIFSLKAWPAWRNISGLDNVASLCRCRVLPEGPSCSWHCASRWATYLSQYSRHSFRSLNVTALSRSSGNSPHGSWR